MDHTTVHTVKAFLFGPYSDTQLIFGLKIWTNKSIALTYKK